MNARNSRLGRSLTHSGTRLWLLPGLMALGIFASRAEGAVIRVQCYDTVSFEYSTVVDRQGLLIPAGTGFLALGTFATLTGDALASATKPQLLADFAGFHLGPFGSQNIAGADGAFDEFSEAIIPASFVGARVFLLMGNGANLASSTQWAILEDGIFPADPPPYVTQLMLELPDLLYSGAVRAGAVVPGVENELSLLGLPPAPLSLAMVPEPSALLLLLLATSLLGNRTRPPLNTKAPC